jgi:outer membrane protein TolC
MWSITKRYTCLLLVGTTSCCTPSFHSTPIKVPCSWETPLQNGMTGEDPAKFLWWEKLNDPLLTALIESAALKNNDVLQAIESRSKKKIIETMNFVTTQIAKSYVQLRGLQNRSKVLQENMDTQNRILDLNEGLSNNGFISLIEYNENTKNLLSFQMQKSLIELSINKLIFHISTLLSHSPGGLYEILYCFQELPEIPKEIPVGLPIELVERHAKVREAKYAYTRSSNKQSLYHYQKTLLDVLENAENALAYFLYEENKLHYLSKIKNIKSAIYQLTKDLHHQGLKDDHDTLTIYQDFLSEENAFIQGKEDLLISYISLYEALVVGWEIVCRK